MWVLVPTEVDVTEGWWSCFSACVRVQVVIDGANAHRGWLGTAVVGLQMVFVACVSLMWATESARRCVTAFPPTCLFRRSLSCFSACVRVQVVDGVGVWLRWLSAATAGPETVFGACMAAVPALQRARRCVTASFSLMRQIGLSLSCFSACMRVLVVDAGIACVS